MDDAFIIGMQPTMDGRLSTEKLCRQVGENTGNLVYAHAISSHIEGRPRVLRFRTPAETLNRAGRIGVIQGANQIGTHFSAGPDRARRLEKVTARLVIIGLGAQSDIAQTIPDLPPGALDWVRRVAERRSEGSRNLGVRGPFTLEVLRRHGLDQHAEVIGCPSLFLNPDPRLGLRIGARQSRLRRIAVVAGHPTWRRLAAIEASLGRLVSETGGSYIGQHGLTMMKLTRGQARDLTEDDLESLRAYVCPDMDPVEFERWSRRHGRVFFSVPDWIDHLRTFDFVVGTRIHGTVVALQAGVPALCVVHDSRTLELCQTMGIPYVLADAVLQGVDRDTLLSHFRFDPDAFDANRRRLAAAYVAFLERNGLRPVRWLRALSS